MSVTDVIDIGEPVVVFGDCFDQTGALYDPATMTLDVTKPDGTLVHVVAPGPGYAGLTHVAAGKFSYLIAAVDQRGVWTYTWTPAQGAIDTGHFLVGEAGSTDGPCDDWCRPEDIFGCAPLVDVTQDLEEAARAAEIASRWLYLLSDRKYPGVCQMTVRPNYDAGCWQMLPTARPTWFSGWADGWAAGLDSDTILLSPSYRVLGIQSVYVDGTLVPSTDYRLEDDVWLVRAGHTPWPTSQDLDLDPHADVGTFEVTFFFGAVPPPDGVAAAKAVAAQVYAACTGLDCALPANLRQRARAGDTIDFADVTEGFFGIAAADRFLEAERYGDANGPAVILSPQAMPTWRRVG